MNTDEDIFFEDESDEEEEEEEDDFPDEVDEDNDDYEPIEALYEPGGDRLEKFASDPWPPTTFILVVIGLALVLLTPPDVSSAWKAALLKVGFSRS